MSSRDARYRSQVAVERRKVEAEHRRAERYRDIALDSVAGLIVATGQDFTHLLGDTGSEADLDRAEVARRVEGLRRRMQTRTR